MGAIFINPISRVSGPLSLGGDKSISHRAVIAASLAKGRSVIQNLSSGKDVRATKEIFERLGISFTAKGEKLVVDGAGKSGLHPPAIPLDAKNSGTTARLLAGILANQKFQTTIVGDESLSLRPMKRVAEPLRMMGADILLSEADTLPMSINPVNCLSPIVYSLPVASAQIKGAILLAGLFLDEVTTVIEPQETRNHTELLFGLPTSEGPDGKKICSSSAYYPVPFEMIVPGDVSSAAFFIVLALLLPKSALRIENVSLNKTRTGYLHILKLMGGDITEENLRSEGGEPVGDILVRSSALRNVDISNELIANIIDEIPILTIAALFAEGDFTIRDVKELRYKESDRINAVCTNLRAAGIEVEEFDDGYAFRGMQSSFCRRAPEFLSFSDHRIAMAFSVLSLLLSTGGSIDALDSIGISNPSFFQNIETISG